MAQILIPSLIRVGDVIAHGGSIGKVTKVELTGRAALRFHYRNSHGVGYLTVDLDENVLLLDRPVVEPSRATPRTRFAAVVK